MIIDCPAMRNCLLGSPACVNLNLVMRVKSIDAFKSPQDKFIEDNLDVFTGPGEFPDTCSIPTKKIHHQICHLPSKLAFSLLDPLKAELDRLVERKAIVKVDVIDERACVNRLVIVEKRSGRLRLCSDPSDLNEYIERTPKLFPTLEELAAELVGNKFFTVLDLSEGFHHCSLDEESS